MKTKYWLPILVLYFFYSLFFINNISVDNEVEIESQSGLEHSTSNLSGEEENSTSFIDLTDFEDFLNDFGNQPFNKYTEIFFDTTGDGKKERVTESIAIKGDVCAVSQEIFKEGQLIWEHSFKLNNKDLHKYFGNDSEIKGMEKYALYYLGLTFSPFVSRLNISSLDNDRSKRIARRFFKNSELSLSEIYNSEMGKNILDYKSCFIFKRNPNSSSIFIWDVNELQFVQIYENNYFST